MTPQLSPDHEAADHEKLLVHNWRVARLAGLGIPGPLAEVNADHLDWHQVARLVQRGCPPRLARPSNRAAGCMTASPGTSGSRSAACSATSPRSSGAGAGATTP